MEALKKRPDLVSLIESIAEDQAIKNYTITDVKTNQKGEGFLGDVFMTTIKDGKNGKELEIVVKSAFVDEKLRQLVPIRISFENEITFYTDVKSIYENLEKEHGIQNSGLAATCFKVSLKEGSEVLALENLKTTGFETIDKKTFLTDDHVRLIFRNYGRFHGLSYVLQDQNPEELTRITNKFHGAFADLYKRDTVLNHIRDIAKTVLTSFIPGEDDEIIKRFEKYTTSQLRDIFNGIVTTNDDYPAILHGDCWSNNLMFKYEETKQARKPTDIRLIDFQLINFASPVCDLSFCLYTGAPKEIYNNLNEYLKIYHGSLSDIVKRCGSDPEKLYPFEVLKEHWRKYSKFGLILAFSVLKLKSTEQDDIKDLKDTVKDGEQITRVADQKFDQEGFFARMKELVYHMLELDAL